MASARANSRVPQPRHLCIIMLRPPLLPRTPQAAPTTEEKSVPLPTLSHHPTHPPPAYFASRPSSPSPTPSHHLIQHLHLVHLHHLLLLQAPSRELSPYPPVVAHLFDSEEKTASGWGTTARRRNGARENERRRKTDERGREGDERRRVPRKSLPEQDRQRRKTEVRAQVYRRIVTR